MLMSSFLLFLNSLGDFKYIYLIYKTKMLALEKLEMILFTFVFEK